MTGFEYKRNVAINIFLESLLFETAQCWQPKFTF